MTLSCFAANLRRAERAVHRLYAEEIRKGGLEPTQFSLLAVLRGGGELSQGELAAGLAIDSTTLTRTLAHLRRRGLVEARPGVDRRRRLYQLTPAGTNALTRTHEHWSRAQRRLRTAVGEAAWKSVPRDLVEVTRAAESA